MFQHEDRILKVMKRRTSMIKRWKDFCYPYRQIEPRESVTVTASTEDLEISFRDSPSYLQSMSEDQCFGSEPEEETSDDKQLHCFWLHPSSLQVFIVGTIGIILQRVWASYALILLIILHYAANKRRLVWMRCLRQEKFHDFLVSEIILQISGISLTSLLMQRQWILYGILFILVGRVVDQLQVWGVVLLNCDDSHRFALAATKIKKRMFKRKRRKLTLRRLLVASTSFHICRKWGAKCACYVLRRQLRHVNRVAVKEIKDSLDYTEIVALQFFDSSMSLRHMKDMRWQITTR